MSVDDQSKISFQILQGTLPHVPSVYSSSSVRRVCCWAPHGQAGAGRPAVMAPQQHSGQQQMRAVSRLQAP